MAPTAGRSRAGLAIRLAALASALVGGEAGCNSPSVANSNRPSGGEIGNNNRQSYTCNAGYVRWDGSTRTTATTFQSSQCDDRCGCGNSCSACAGFYCGCGNTNVGNSCQMYCPNAATVPNAARTSTNARWAGLRSATWTCNAGYTGGSATATCTSPGATLAPAGLACARITCPAPAVANSDRRRAATIYYNTRQTYTCAANYVTVQYTGDGRPSGQYTFASGLCINGASVSHSTCRVATCGATHSSQPNAAATTAGRRTAGSSYGFTCSTNYGAVRTFSATCTADATGSYTAPTGRCTQLQCANAAAADRNAGAVAGSTRAGTSLTIACTTNFGVGGVATARSYTRRCVDAGRGAPAFAPPAATCAQIVCSAPHADAGAIGGRPGPESADAGGEPVTYTCAQGSAATTAANAGSVGSNAYTMQCDAGTGRFADPGLRCRPITCQMQSGLNSGVLPARGTPRTGDTDALGTLVVSCDANYGVVVQGQPFGSPTARSYQLTCGLDRRFAGPASGTCARIRCTDVAVIANTVATWGTRSTDPSFVFAGETVTYTCDANHGINGDGFTLRPTFSKLCRQQGTMAPILGESCDRVSCGTPPDDPHATESAEEGRAGEEDIVYTCDEGYVIHTPALGGFSDVPSNSIACRDSATHTDRVRCTEACVPGAQYSNAVGDCMGCTPPCNYGGGEYQQRDCVGFADRICRSCESGAYRAERASTGCTACGLTCLAGQYVTGDCLRSAIVGDPLSCASCAAGTYVGGAVTAATGSDRCAPCGLGWVCPAGAGATARNICGAIAEYMDEPQGTVCKTADDGQYTAIANGAPNVPAIPHVRQVPCDAGHRCSAGIRTGCSTAGAQYQDERAQADCKTVDPGHYSTPESAAVRTRQVRCEPGYACTAGVRAACPANTYAASPGQTECTARTAADAGWYVVTTAVGTGLRTGQIRCDPGNYCSAQNDAGDYILQQCGRGHACADGIDRSECIAGATFSDTETGTGCTECRVCPVSQNLTAACNPNYNTVCEDRVPPFFVDATATITLEAAVSLFGVNQDPVEAFDDQTPAAIANLTCRIVRTGSDAFMTALPTSGCTSCGCAGFSAFVNTSMLGDHTVGYTVLDEAGNTATASRTVSVVDTIAPVIALNRPDDVTIAVSNEDPFAPILNQDWIGAVTAADAYDASIGRDPTLRIQIAGRDALLRAMGVSATGGIVDAGGMSRGVRLRAEGWGLTYTVSDVVGNAASQAVQTFHLVDRTPPELTLAAASYVIEADAAAEPFATFSRGGTAVDFVDGVIDPVQILVGCAGFALNIPGAYTAIYNATDLAGNTAVRTAPVTVEDTVAPVIVLEGNTSRFGDTSSIQVDYGAAWSEPGYSATDRLDAAETLVVVATGTVLGGGSATNFTFVQAASDTPLNTSAPVGTRFLVNYTCEDGHGNVGFAVRTVTVLDLSPPLFDLGAGGGDRIELTAGSVHFDVCPTVLDTHDTAWQPGCIDRLANDTTPPVAGTVYRVGLGITARNATRFEVPGEFDVLYWAVDDAGNRGNITRVYVIGDGPASSSGSAGLGATGISAIGAAAVAVIIVAAVGLAVSRRRAAAGKTVADAGPDDCGPMPPSPEAWYHGEIDRRVADDRLLAAGTPGAFLVRSKSSDTEPASFALSVLAATGRPVHYTVVVPTDGSAAAVFQGVAANGAWGCCLADVIATLEVQQPEFKVKTPLTSPAPIPSNARELAGLFGHADVSGARPAAADVYAQMAASPSRYELSTAFRLVNDGLFYRLFQPVARVAEGVVLFELVGTGAQSRATPIGRGRVDAWTEVYVRVEPARLPGLLGVAPEPAHRTANGFGFGGGSQGQPATYNPTFDAAASGTLVYDTRGAAGGKADRDTAQPPAGGAQFGEMYATVNKGASLKGGAKGKPQKQQQRVGSQRYAIPMAGGGFLYSDADHGSGAGGYAAPAVQSEVMYSGLYSSVNLAPGTLGPAAPPMQSDVVYNDFDIILLRYSTVRSTQADGGTGGGGDRTGRPVYGESRVFAQVSDDGRHLRLAEPMYMESSDLTHSSIDC